MEKKDDKPNNYIITERPNDMDFQTYKALKNHQKKALKKYKRGR